jgi:hypothetical protein
MTVNFFPRGIQGNKEISEAPPAVKKLYVGKRQQIS